MTRYQNEYQKEETILTPGSTRIQLEGWITDDTYIFSPNQYGEYIVKFQPQTNDDLNRFFEAAERSLMEVEMMMGPYSGKTATKHYEDNRGCPYSSQLFAPIVNVNKEQYNNIYFRCINGQCTTIKGHFRDGPDGSVYFQVDYIDLYEPDEPVEEPLPDNYDPDDDW